MRMPNAIRFQKSGYFIQFGIFKLLTPLKSSSAYALGTVWPCLGQFKVPEQVAQTPSDMVSTQTDIAVPGGLTQQQHPVLSASA